MLVFLLLATKAMGTSEAEFESRYRDCILQDTNCPNNSSVYSYQRLLPTLQLMQRKKPPRECDCNIQSEGCVRRCFYAFRLQLDILAAEFRAGNDMARREQFTNFARSNMNRLRPCILEGRNCQQVYGPSLNYMSDWLRYELRINYMPPVCNCDVNNENCGRPCMYAILKSEAGF
uniref:Uncharacterized protein n=1 Tax=Macrostomum lignano TaxID=282301 RepID=A0A1I8G7C1_9PLAT